MSLNSSARGHHVWYRVEPRLLPGTLLETFEGKDRPQVADARVVEFARTSGELTLPAYTTAYDPMETPELLGEFLATFGPPHVPTDEEVLSFYRRYGAIGERGWFERLGRRDQEEAPPLAREGLREPVWHTRQLARELRICCQLYEGLAANRPEQIAAVLGRAPTSGQLVNVMLLSGEVHKPWMSPEELAQRVGSFGKWEPSPEDPGREFSAEECFDLARALLSHQLNLYEARAHRQWVRRTHLATSHQGPRARSKRPAENALLAGTRRVVFSSLVTALHLQLSDGAEAGRLLRRCPGCERVFWADPKSQQYCSTRCSGAYRRREFTRRQQARDKGPSDAGR